MPSFQWFVICFLALAAGERLYEHRYSKTAERGSRKMEWSFAVFHSLHVLIYLAAGTEAALLRTRPQWGVTILGLVAFCTATLVRLVAIRTLGKFWSLHVEIRDQHKLITTGIYQHVRHPAYAAIIVEVCSVPLVCNAYWTLILAVTLYLPLLALRWRREEREMTEKFGKEYEQYCKSVPAFVPRLRTRPEKAHPMAGTERVTYE